MGKTRQGRLPDGTLSSDGTPGLCMPPASPSPPASQAQVAHSYSDASDRVQKTRTHWDDLGDPSPASAAARQRTDRPRTAPAAEDERCAVARPRRRRPKLRSTHGGLPVQRSPASGEAAWRGRTNTTARGVSCCCRRAHSLDIAPTPHRQKYPPPWARALCRTASASEASGEHLRACARYRRTTVLRAP